MCVGLMKQVIENNHRYSSATAASGIAHPFHHFSIHIILLRIVILPPHMAQ